MILSNGLNQEVRAIYFKPHQYQDYAIERVMDTEALALFLEMGLRQDGYHTNGN